MNAARDETIEAFIREAGWQDAAQHPLPGDASTRRYIRLARNGRSAMLMDQPQQAEAPAAPADATPQQRAALGYNAMARLAGADCARFMAAALYLRETGLAAPEILAADTGAGLLLLEDMGDALFADVLAGNALGGDGSEENLYAVAASVLARLHARQAPALLADGVPLFAYDETAQIAETDLLTQWFLPHALGRAASEAEIAQHRDLWRGALASAHGERPVFVHRDYHAQNLMWLAERADVARVGLIDFQDAVAGSPAYDLVSLTEDARRDVGVEIAATTVRHYTQAMAAQGLPVDAPRFAAECAVMAAQRNAKIVGIFARLHRRDGKSRYLDYLPRVWRYLESDLRHDALSGLRAWYDDLFPRAARHGGGA